MYTFTADQQLLLARHILPEDLNKYIVDMALVLFDEENLKNTTAANLEKTKISFISSKLFYDTIICLNRDDK